jgi:type VI protein secretion system component VasF
MTLAELCDPFFLYLCKINRAARKGGIFEYAKIRNEIQGILQDMARTAAADPRLGDQFTRMERPLIFFADSMIAEGALPFAAEWNEKRLAFERNELAGDEKFFDLLDETLADPGEQATERLTVFYICLGLGFSGWYANKPEHLQRKMMEISARIPHLLGAHEAARICPEAYESLNTSNLIEPPGQKLAGIGIALAGLCVVLFLTNMYLYRWSSNDLVERLDRILSQRAQPSHSAEPLPPTR